MRIAIVSTPFIRVPPNGYGGTELFCWELSEELHRRGHEVMLYTTGDAETACEKRSLFSTPRWPPEDADEVHHAAWALRQADREGAEIIHLSSGLGVPLTRFVDAPVVHTIHHQREEALSRIYAAHPRVHYVAISQRQRDLEAPLRRCSVIHHGLGVERHPPRIDGEGDGGYLLHLGRFAPEKGTHFAVEVAQRSGVRMLLAGRVHPQDRGYFDREVAPRIEGGLVDDVGEVGPADKLALLRGARALVCPLDWEEPFGLVAVEAMLCGTPVLGFARGSFPEIVDEGVTGFLMRSGDVGAMAKRARDLDGFDRAACAARARERFSVETMTDHYLAIYALAVRRRGDGVGAISAPARAR